MRGRSKSPSGSCVMPIFSITRRDLAFPTAVKATISSSPECAEAVGERRGGRLGRVAVAPVLGGQSPADLHDRLTDRRLVAVEADEADEVGDARELDRPQSPALTEQPLVDQLGHRIGLGAGERRGEPLHHARVGVQRRKRRAVCWPPGAQQQAFGRDRGDLGGHGFIVAGRGWTRPTRASRLAESVGGGERAEERVSLFAGHPPVLA